MLVLQLVCQIQVSHSGVVLIVHSLMSALLSLSAPVQGKLSAPSDYRWNGYEEYPVTVGRLDER